MFCPRELSKTPLCFNIQQVLQLATIRAVPEVSGSDILSCSIDCLRQHPEALSNGVVCFLGSLFVPRTAVTAAFINFHYSASSLRSLAIILTETSDLFDSVIYEFRHRSLIGFFVHRQSRSAASSLRPFSSVQGRSWASYGSSIRVEYFRLQDYPSAAARICAAIESSTSDVSGASFFEAASISAVIGRRWLHRLRPCCVRLYTAATSSTRSPASSSSSSTTISSSSLSVPDRRRPHCP